VNRIPIRRAVLSVSDKAGLPELAGDLTAAGVQVVATGTTAAAVRAAGRPVTEVSELTGFPEVLGGRVKTLHPALHAGLLADLRREAHARELEELGLLPFQLVVGNLYPFRETARSGSPPDDVIEQIDIGGPTLLRAAAKNHSNVAVVVSPRQYGEVTAALEAGGFTAVERRGLAAQAFAHVAAYDVAIANWFAGGEELPESLGWWLHRDAVLRYGENPHQRAALYVDPDAPSGLAGAALLQGKAMSYNNYVDADAAGRLAGDFAEPCVAVVKHTNPCGVAVADDIVTAYRLALDGDPVSAYGGVVAANRPVTESMASALSEVFTEVLVAPGYEPAARSLLSSRRNLRLLQCPVRSRGEPDLELRAVDGGWLAQTPDRLDAAGDRPSGWRLAAGDPVDAGGLADLAFAWRAVRGVKSNAILLATGRAAVGIGMGQVNRVDAARLAVGRAGQRAAGAVAASDAFFPFPDGLRVLADAGVRAVVQPGGSVRDDEVIAAAEAAGISLYLTGVRHFWH
jgi:phosphoribosylaminoimidazolecarboxamide formyltransferase/IMP cyclohydrolase